MNSGATSVQLRFQVSQGLAISSVRFSQFRRSFSLLGLFAAIFEGFCTQSSTGFSSEWRGKISSFSTATEIVSEASYRNLVRGCACSKLKGCSTILARQLS